MNTFRLRNTLGTLLLATLLLPSATVAQWSSNAAQNLTIANRTNDQVQPKIRSTADGGCYISWFDNARAATTCICSGSTRRATSNGRTTAS